MTENEFQELVDSAVLRITANIGHIGYLVSTQWRNGNEPTLREPEIRTAFQLTAEDYQRYYGIEVPTRHTYRFEGEGYRRALIDFVLLTSSSHVDRDVILEFKEGQPAMVKTDELGAFDCPAITKDLHKLFAEPATSGRCMFHICQAAHSGTVPAVIRKYNEVTKSAKEKAAVTIANHVPMLSQHAGGWFFLYILVLHGRGQQQGWSLQRYSWNGMEWTVKI